MKQHEMPDMQLDAIDWRILGLLQGDARLSNVELAKAVGLSPSPCLNRVRALEQAGYLLRVVVPDIQVLEDFILNFLSRVPGVGNIKSSFALKQVKYQTALPLPAAAGTGREARA